MRTAALRWLLLFSLFGEIRPAFSADEPKPAPPQPIAIKELKRRSAVDFETEVLPIFKANCLACHNQTATKADLVLETPQTIRKGGESGPAVVPGKPAESLLLQMASHQKRPLMPPKDNKVAASDLKPEELGLIKLWIEQGAKGEVRANIPVQWRPLPKTVHPIYAVALTSDGQFAACGRGNGISVYHIPSRELAGQLLDPKLEKYPGAAHLDLVQSLDFNRDGTLLASGAFREVKLWRRSIGSNPLPFTAIASNAVFDLAPNGRWVAFAIGTNQISVWDTKSNAERHKLVLSGSPTRLIRFNTDSTKLAAISAEGVLDVWNAREGKLLATTNLSKAASAVTWLSPATLALPQVEKSIEVWAISGSTTQSLSLQRTLKATAEVMALASASNYLAVSDGDGQVHLWDWQSGKKLHDLKHEAPVTALALSSDGKRMASAGSNKAVCLWSTEGKQIAELKGDRYANEAVEAAERMVTLASNNIVYRKSVLKTAETQRTNQEARVSKAMATNEVVEKILQEKKKNFDSATEAKHTAEKALTDLQSQITNSVLKAETNKLDSATATDSKDTPAESKSTDKPVSSSTNAIDSKAIAALKQKLKDATEKLPGLSNALASAEKDLKKAELTKSIAAHELELAKASLTKSGEEVKEATSLLEKSEEKQKQKRAEADSLKERAASAEHIVRALAFSPDNRILASAGEDSAVRTWSAESGLPFEVYRSSGKPIPEVQPMDRLAFPSSKTVLAGSRQRLFQCNLTPVWRLERTIGKPTGDSPLSDRVNAVRFSPDARLLATGGGEPSRAGEIKIWNVADGKLMRDFPSIHSDTVLSLDFSPDGKLLASGGADKFLRVTSLESGKLLKTFEGHTHHVLGVKWKQDGRTVASAGADALLKIWNSATAERLKNVEGFGKEVTSVSFIGVTDQVLAAAGDGQLRLVRDSGESVRSFVGANDYLYSAAATPDGKVIVAGGQDGILRVWDGRDGKPQAEFPP